MDMKDLTSMFRTKMLVGKLKLFQTCRGVQYMKSYNSVYGPGAGAGQNNLDLPVESDLLFCFSTVMGCHACCKSGSGSRFIEILI